jgi:hypothetical protein
MTKKHHALLYMVCIACFGLFSPVLVGAETPQSVVITNETVPTDLYNWLTTDLDASTLTIAISYEGGCESHGFDLVWDGSLSTAAPPQANVVLSHDSVGDTCDELVTDSFRFDLTPIRDTYQERDPLLTKIVINFIDYDGEQHKFDYVFPAQDEDEHSPLVCTMEARECPDGTTVGRDAENGCKFRPCPSGDATDEGTENEDTQGDNSTDDVTADDNAPVSCASSSDCGNGLVCISFPDTDTECSEPDPCSYYQCDEGTLCQEKGGELIGVTCETQEPAEQEPVQNPAADETIEIEKQPVQEPLKGNDSAAQVTGAANQTIHVGNDTITVNNISIKNLANASVKGDKIIVVTVNGPREILPPPVVDGTEIELVSSEGRPLYVVKGYKRARLLFLIPMKAYVITKYDATTGILVKVTLPWWSFLAKIG